MSRWLKEPLIHFLLLGGLIFVVYNAVVDTGTADGEIFISGIKCRIISDVPPEPDVPQPQVNQARRSVCFEGLSMLQVEQINQFIHTHATELLH